MLSQKKLSNALNSHLLTVYSMLEKRIEFDRNQ